MAIGSGLMMQSRMSPSSSWSLASEVFAASSSTSSLSLAQPVTVSILSRMSSSTSERGTLVMPAPDWRASYTLRLESKKTTRKAWSDSGSDRAGLASCRISATSRSVVVFLNHEQGQIAFSEQGRGGQGQGAVTHQT